MITNVHSVVFLIKRRIMPRYLKCILGYHHRRRVQKRLVTTLWLRLLILVDSPVTTSPKFNQMAFSIERLQTASRCHVLLPCIIEIKYKIYRLGLQWMDASLQRFIKWASLVSEECVPIVRLHEIVIIGQSKFVEMPKCWVRLTCFSSQQTLGIWTTNSLGILDRTDSRLWIISSRRLDQL